MTGIRQSSVGAKIIASFAGVERMKFVEQVWYRSLIAKNKTLLKFPIRRELIVADIRSIMTL